MLKIIRIHTWVMRRGEGDCTYMYIYMYYTCGRWLIWACVACCGSWNLLPIRIHFGMCCWLLTLDTPQRLLHL